ncbi:MAG: aconitate hydratase [Thermoleophilia bacterium]|nr:aconitate hydratase [Thermoleophilia bacterium]
MLRRVSDYPFNTLDSFDAGSGESGRFCSLPKLEAAGVGPVSKLPVSIRIVLESVLRNCDGQRITEEHVKQLANWSAKAERSDEIPFVVARIVLQDFTGVPLLVDLAAMRSAVDRMGKDPKVIEPLVPVDLVVDHSVQVDYSGSDDALERNMAMEFKRNRERYEFLKWGMQAFDGFRVVPSGIGIVHQVNLEYLAQGVLEREGVFFPDTLVGTDSHTTMINGIGIVGWGVGGIEAEAGMLGQPVYILTPDVVGVELTGALAEGVTATDLVLSVTEMLRAEGVVGKFVEYYGPGAESLSVPDRATIGNMAPEYGATMGFFPFDDRSVEYMQLTGRDASHIETVANYFKAQGLYGMPRRGDIEYSTDLVFDLSTVHPSVAGPKRPQDRIDLPKLKDRFTELFQAPTDQNGYGKTADELNKSFAANVAVHNGGNGAAGGDQAREAEESHLPHTSHTSESEMVGNRPTPDLLQFEDPAADGERVDVDLRHGDVLIAAITSCTNTSNPSVMLAAGLLAKKAVEKGLSVGPAVKTSLAPGSRVVSDYLEKTGLRPYLDQLGFNLVGYGCTTCIGNSGPLDTGIEQAIVGNDIVAASVLSGNRNFEARVHQNIKANFLMSPPLVVAFALAGTVEKDLSSEPLATTADGDVYLKDIWPTLDEVRECMTSALDPDTFRRLYGDFAEQNPMWNEIPSKAGLVYEWETESTYIQEPPFFENFSLEPPPVDAIEGARPLAILGDSVTTDHISPAGAIKQDSPAGRYLVDRGIQPLGFNSYGSRRGNDRVMTRGTFANVRIRNLMAPGTEGGVTLHHNGATEQMAIYDAAERYRTEGRPLVVFAGKEYGTGSSRDWAAKGAALLGVRAVVAESYERIHRSNLVGMGVLPCVFNNGETAASLGLDGSETFDLPGAERVVAPRQQITLAIHRADGSTHETTVTARIDTPIEIEYFRHGGILPYVLRQLVAGA